MEDDKKDFTCLRCGHNSTTKQNLIKHLNNIDSCEIKKGLQNITIKDYLKTLQKQVNDNAVVCKFCGSMFNQNRYLKSHFIVCKHNPKSEKYKGKQPIEERTDKQYIAILEDDLKFSKEINKELHKELQTLRSKLGIQSDVKNFNIVQNITINNFGEETIEHLSNPFLLNCIMKESAGIRNFVEKLHFDNEVPENKNVRYKSTKRKILEIVENNDWVAKDEKEVIKCMIRKACSKLREYYLQDEELMERDDNELEHKVIGFLNELNEQSKTYKTSCDMLKALIETHTNVKKVYTT
jgi:transcription elongation factor Elf1